MINNDKSAVIVFAKMPVAGKVKTRLAIDYDNEFAVEFYKNCAAHIFYEISQLKELGIDSYLFYGIDDKVTEIKKWVNKNFNYCPQANGDLGNKISQAFQKVFAQGKTKIIIVGTDIPDITKETIINSFDSLNTSDIVISPSNDGGYNLLGMKKFYPELFKEIEWSTGDVFNKTIERTKRLGLTARFEKCLIDIDDKNDLIEWLSLENKGNSQLRFVIQTLLKERGGRNE